VTWGHPDEQFAQWRQDRQHAPKATVPLSDATSRRFAQGFSQAARTLGLPIHVTSRLFNYYYYMSIGPAVPPEQMPAAEMAALPGVFARATTFADRWAREWLPELEQSWDAWSAVETSKLDGADLLQRWEDMLKLYVRVWDIHFELLLPALIALSSFIEFAQEHLGTSSDLDATKMLVGIDNLSLHAGRKMWALSRAALANLEVEAVIRAGEAGTVMDRLGQSEAGRKFRNDVDAFLQDFGYRSDTVQDLSDPSWKEDPGRFFTALRPYLDNDQDPDVKHRELAAEREATVARARQELANAPAEIRGQFEALLKGAQDCSRLQEDHNHWIDQRSLYEGRKLALEVGQRLVSRGQLDTAEDALYLWEDQFREAILDPQKQVRDIVAKHRAERAYWENVEAPPMIGTDYGPPPLESPVGRTIMRFFGGPPSEPQRDVVKGNPGSSGKYRGIARIVPTIADAARLGLGEILVTPTTSPPWTPLFATAGAIVTDTGGPLSHCAIVAREYGLPAVVGTGYGTHQIRDGQLIEVDGDAGLVRLLD
jgi:pyruvate,water dikinase